MVDQMIKQENRERSNPTNPLKASLATVMEQYGIIQAEVKRTHNFKHPFRDIIGTEIPSIINRLAKLPENYRVVGSYGKGRWTDVPWIAVFDSRITVSALKGIYIVYLFNKDTRELYLTLNQGVTDVAQGESTSDAEKAPVFATIGKSQNNWVIEDRKSVV